MGVPLHAIDIARPYLEKYSHMQLTHSSNLGDLVPMVLKSERDNLRAFLTGQPYSIAFDGASRLGEVLAVIVRVVDADTFRSTQKLLGVRLFSRSLAGEEIAEGVHSIVCGTYKLDTSLCMAAQRDRVSANNVAFRRLSASVGFSNMADLRCLSHMVDTAGSQLVAKHAEAFESVMSSIFSRSPAAVKLWRDAVGARMPGGSETRWWSEWFNLEHLMQHFHLVEPWLAQCVQQNLCEALTGQLMQMFRGYTQQVPARTNNAGVVVPAHNVHVAPVTNEIAFELAVAVDIGKPLVKTTYAVEGDDPCLVFEAFDRLLEAQNSLVVLHTPNVDALLRTMNIPNARMRVCDFAASPRAYLKSKIGDLSATLVDVGFVAAGASGSSAPPPQLAQNGAAPLPPPASNTSELSDMMKLLCLARLGDPWRLLSLHPNTQHIDNLAAALPFLRNDPALVSRLKEELPRYMAAAAQLPEVKDVQAWWAQRRQTLPAWASLVRVLLLLPPSSAAPERVFSLLRLAIDERQERALGDYIEASLMLQYNNRNTSSSHQDRRKTL